LPVRKMPPFRTETSRGEESDEAIEITAVANLDSKASSEDSGHYVIEEYTSLEELLKGINKSGKYPK
ncbi:MAG: hypothetical protein ACLPUX_07100, partial [Syntrophobacteraceae bacterium]